MDHGFVDGALLKDKGVTALQYLCFQ